MKHNKKTLNIFLVFLMISLIGNECAHFAIFWYGLSLTKGINSMESSAQVLTAFYAAQALGAFLIAPLASSYFDKMKNISSSILIDCLYSIILILFILLNDFRMLNSISIFIATLFLGGLKILHKGTVNFGAITKLSESLKTNDVVTKYFASYNLTVILGSIISGVSFKYLGFSLSMWLAVITFIPMPFIYYMIFKGEKKKPSASSKMGLFDNLKNGFLFLKNDQVLFPASVSVLLLNVTSSVYPAIVGYAFKEYYPNRTDIASIAIGVAMLTATLFINKIKNIPEKLTAHHLFPISLIPAIMVLLICLAIPNPWIFTISFFLSCLGANLRNITTGGFRVKRVPSDMTSRVNTAYLSLIYIGQIFGGLIVIPFLEKNLFLGTIVTLLFFLLSSFYSFFQMPRMKIKTLNSGG